MRSFRCVVALLLLLCVTFMGSTSAARGRYKSTSMSLGPSYSSSTPRSSRRASGSFVNYNTERRRRSTSSSSSSDNRSFGSGGFGSFGSGGFGRGSFGSGFGRRSSGVGMGGIGGVGSFMSRNREGASIPNLVFNLVKSIVGVGVLSLPAGVAAFANDPSALVPALMLIAGIGVLSGFGFSLIGRVCAYTNSASYREAWAKTMGYETSWIPAWSTTLKTLFACLAFSMVLADSISGLINSSRNAALLPITVLVLLPLCLLKDLKSLSPFSLLGVCGMAYTAFAMTVRYVDGSYALPDGYLLKSVAAKKLIPRFGNRGAGEVWTSKSLILVCMLSTAYMAHFNAPKFYLELRNNTIRRYDTVVRWSFGISILLMGFITAVGFLTFGEASAGLVLNNYASTDTWMSGSRIAVAIALVFSYPLAFVGCRDGFLDLLQIPYDRRTTGMLNVVTLILLGSITVAASSLKDVSLVLALAGATLGNALTYVYPALMYSSVVRRQRRRNEEPQVVIAMAAAWAGVIMGFIGARMALEKVKKY